MSVLGTVEQGTSLVEGGPDREYCQREDLRVRVTTSYTRYSCVTTATPVTLDTRSPVWLEAEPGTHINMLHLCLAAAAWTSELANDAASSPPRVLVTGATGRTGSALYLQLKARHTARALLRARESEPTPAASAGPVPRA